MQRDVCLVGFGRVGSVAARLLREWGLPPLVVDASARRVREAEREGFEARLMDAASGSGSLFLARTCRVVATALPSRAAVEALRSLIAAGAGRIVDVSYIPDPMEFAGEAAKRGVTLVVDAGVAPGLSNMMVHFSVEHMDSVKDAYIYVGGLSEEEKGLGLVASWNMEDLVEEYTRPARAIVGGRLVALDPVAGAVSRVEVPGAGVFEALPTDGLRTLLHTLQGRVASLVEYTLRYPGHLSLLRGLRSLGLLDERSVVVESCSIEPRALLARLLEERLPREGDRLVLYTRVRGRSGRSVKTVEYILDARQSEAGLDTPVLTYATGLVHAWLTRHVAVDAGDELPAGVVPPERFSSLLPRLLEELGRRGLVVWRRTTYEEEVHTGAGGL
ncbi:MAG: saccharopine dehydrogenase [Crenarchaeota archaeon]|nr:saccharopine dehydrogenase [Thermoproteota archaeon]